MNTLNPWLDADEVRRMALRLIRPVREPAADIADAGFDEDFVGFTQPLPSSPALPQAAPAAVFETATSAAPVSHNPPIPPAPPQPPAPLPTAVTEQAVPKAEETSTTAARGPFLDRIRRFRDWLESEFSAGGVFILDREGSVIFDESELGRLHFLARSLALASRRPGTSAANVHVKIGASTTLEVIPVETAYGCLVLGALVPEALPPASVSEVMTALAQVAAPPATS
jgi:hypothetical protein